MSFWKVTLTCCVLLAAQTAGAQDWKGRGRLAGEVKTEDGTPLPGASVKLFRPKFEDGTTLTTDKKGRWAYLGLTGGPWNIDISAEGYVPRQLSVSVSEARRTPPIKVTLEVYVPPGPPPEVKEAIEKGDAAYEAGRYSEAREHYEKLLVLTPELGKDLHMQLARCYKQEGNYEKELEQLQAVVDLDPDNMEVRTLMASRRSKAASPSGASSSWPPSTRRPSATPTSSTTSAWPSATGRTRSERGPTSTRPCRSTPTTSTATSSVGSPA